MHFSQALCGVLALIICASAKGIGGASGYGGAGGLGGEAGGYGGGAGGLVGGYGRGTENFAPKPYGFGYSAPDAIGSHFRKEQGDAQGNVQGSYGYTDAQGLYRQVDYLANAAGFKASVKSNEPGTDDKLSPAFVDMEVQHPPAGVVEKYIRGGGVGGFGGQRGGFAGGKEGYGGAVDVPGAAGGLYAGIPTRISGKSGY